MNIVDCKKLVNRKQKCYSNCIELHSVVQNFIKVGDSIADEEKNYNHCGSGCIDDFYFHTDE